MVPSTPVHLRWEDSPLGSKSAERRDEKKPRQQKWFRWSHERVDDLPVTRKPASPSKNHPATDAQANKLKWRTQMQKGGSTLWFAPHLPSPL